MKLTKDEIEALKKKLIYSNTYNSNAEVVFDLEKTFSHIEALEKQIEAGPCPFVETSREGTSFCRLAEAKS